DCRSPAGDAGSGWTAPPIFQSVSFRQAQALEHRRKLTERDVHAPCCSPGGGWPGRPPNLRRPYSSRQCNRWSRRGRPPPAPATGDSVLGLDLDWPARVAEVTPHFVAHSSTKFVRQGRQCLAGGSAAAFKRAVIRIERRQHKGVRHSTCLDLRETGLTEQLF